MNRYLVFDIETDNLLYEVSRFFCAVSINENEEVTRYYRKDIEKLFIDLSNSKAIVGHNIIGYDLPALEKLFPDLYNKYLSENMPEVHDTLLYSQMITPRLKSHSLKAWGERLASKGIIAVGKTEFNDFTKFSEEMMDYCEQDVYVNWHLYDQMVKREKEESFFKSRPYLLECKIKAIQVESEMYGVAFDVETAMQLIMEVQAEMDTIRHTAEKVLGYHKNRLEYKLKADGSPSHFHIKRLGRIMNEYGKEPEHGIEGKHSYILDPIKITLDTKNLLVARLLELGWKPTMFTPGGSPKLVDAGEACPNLSKVEGFEKVDIGKYFVLKHRLSILQGFFRVIRDDDKIPSEANTLGAITGRYTHRKIANLPAVRSLLGSEIRSLFGPGEGRVQVGCDLSGIEARLFANAMNDKEYIDVILHGDIHTDNQQRAGLPTRDAAKTFFYAFLYGAGDTKIGQIIGGNAEDGRRIKETFLKTLPGLVSLIDTKQEEAEKGYITGLDGRRVFITKNEVGMYDVRKALNTYLQSAAAQYFKYWLMFTNEEIKSRDLDAQLMISYHDELQFSCHPDAVEDLKEILEIALKGADRELDIVCPNAIEIKTGKNWMDCH